MRLVAYISQHGLHGEIHFRQRNDTLLEIKSSLETTLQYPDQVWSWGVHQLPVDYAEPDPHRRCHLANLGTQIINFDNELGYLVLPGNETSVWNAQFDLTGWY